MTRACPCGTPLQKCEISQAHALRVGYLKSMSSAIFTCDSDVVGSIKTCEHCQDRIHS
jgi:hypothetical protein